MGFHEGYADREGSRAAASRKGLAPLLCRRQMRGRSAFEPCSLKPPPGFHEGQKIHGTNGVVFGLLDAIHADLDHLPPVDGVEAAEAPIPDGENETQILVPMALGDGVMKLVVCGRDEKLAPNSLVGKPDMRMAQMKAEEIEDRHEHVE